MSTKEWIISGKLLDMPLNSERYILANRVERFVDGWSVNGQPVCCHETAVKKIVQAEA